MKHVEIGSQLLSTKLFVPSKRSTLVPRLRLVARMTHGLTRPLTLISAPAGFGKTTLVSEWRSSDAGRDYPLAWLSLDEDDNDPVRFLTYLVAALGILKPDLTEAKLGMLQSPQPPILQAFLTGLINELGDITTPFALVLDDYHVIRVQPVHDALIFLLDHLPRQMHFVLLTRVDPPLPLARLRARDQLVEIRANDLRFTSHETQAFFNQVMDLALSPVDMTALELRTEGWIAGLQMAALAIQSSNAVQQTEDVAGFIGTFTGSHQYVADFLSAEVLNRQPEPIRAFLLQTSILDQLTGDLCDHLTGHSDGQSMLGQLDKSNLFLVHLDEENHWYRFHHLFAEMTRNQLRQVYPDKIPVLHLRAAEWFEQHGFFSEAIHHSQAAGDLVLAARLVENNAMAMLMRGDSVTVLNWISSIAPMDQKRPWLGIYQSLALTITGQVADLEPLLQRVESQIETQVSGTDSDRMRCHLIVIRALAAERLGETQRAIDLAYQALEQLPESETLIRGVVTLVLGDASWATGDLIGATQAFTMASRIARTADNFVVSAGALSSVAELLIEQSKLFQAKETFQSALEMSTRTDGRMMPIASLAFLGLSNLNYEWNNLETVEHEAQQTLELGLRWGNPATLAGIHLLRTRLRRAQGDDTGAARSLREAEELTRRQGVPQSTVDSIDAMRVRLWLAQDNHEDAVRWALQSALDPSDEIHYSRQIAYLTLGRILTTQDKTDEALTLFERLMEQFERRGQMRRVLELLLLQALALKKRGDLARALAALARALALGEAEGYKRVYLDEGAPMAELLRHAGTKGIASKHVARLLSDFNWDTGGISEGQQPLIEPLTNREREILRLLASGLSNQAISVHLFVALGTVKTHTASLYRKLGVSSRTAAIARASALGLL